MKKSFIYIQFLLIACLSMTVGAFADVKIKARQTMQGQAYENTVYIKGKRERTEQNMGGMQSVMITQCDLRRSVQLMPQSKAYLVTVFDEGVSSNQSAIRNPQSKIEKGGVINMTVTNKDTGERKQMFGYTARRIITTMITESSPDACTQTKTKMEIDGWYIDAAFALNCDYGNNGGYMPRSEKAGCQDRFNAKTIGAAKTGYPVYTKTTMFDDKGNPTYSFTNEVLELSKATLDQALFEVPADYREVKDSSELYASMASSQNSIEDEDYNANSGVNQNVKNLANQKPSVAATLGAKKAGVIRLGLASVKTGDIGEGMNATDLAAAVGNTFGQYLKASNIELVQIEAKLPTAMESEARQKECDYIVYATVSHKKGKSGFGLFKKIAPALANVIPAGSSTGSAIAANAASTAILTTASVAGSVKSKDEITLEYQLMPASSTTAVAANTLTAKAKSDGQDIISPLVEQAAQAIINAASKK
jgi:hypothetical protein